MLNVLLLNIVSVFALQILQIPKYEQFPNQSSPTCLTRYTESMGDLTESIGDLALCIN